MPSDKDGNVRQRADTGRFPVGAAHRESRPAPLAAGRITHHPVTNMSSTYTVKLVSGKAEIYEITAKGNVLYNKTVTMNGGIASASCDGTHITLTGKDGRSELRLAKNGSLLKSF